MKLSLSLFVLSTLWGASVGQVQQTIAEIVIADENLSTLETVVAAVPAAAEFLQNNEATLFAPSNAAFADLDQKFLTKIQTPAFKHHLADAVGYHVIPGKTIMTGDIMDLEEVPTLGEETLVYLRESNGGVINIGGNARIVQENMQASNGVLHVIDSVLLPFWVSVSAYEIMEFIPQLSAFTSLIDDTMLTDTVNGTGPITIFAPFNDTFAAALAANPDIDLTDLDLAIAIAKSHIVADVITFDDITDGMEVMALSGETLTFNVLAGGNITLNGIPFLSNNEQVLVNNGVIHALDGGIIVPTGSTAAPDGSTAAPDGTTSAPAASPNSGVFGLTGFVAGVVASCVATMMLQM